MATSRMRDLYALSGISEARDLEQLRDYLAAGFATQWQEVANQVNAGRISVEVGPGERLPRIYLRSWQVTGQHGRLHASRINLVGR